MPVFMYDKDGQCVVKTLEKVCWGVNIPTEREGERETGRERERDEMKLIVENIVTTHEFRT